MDSQIIVNMAFGQVHSLHINCVYSLNKGTRLTKTMLKWVLNKTVC